MTEAFIDDLRKRLHVTVFVLDSYCGGRFGCNVAALSKAHASMLIEQLLAWAESRNRMPPELLRAAGQMDLMGVNE